MHFTSSQDGRLFQTTPRGGTVWLGPRLKEIATGSQWANDENDHFPSHQQFADQYERMLTWFSEKFPEKYFEQVITRLHGTSRSRDETFAEIIAAYFIEKAGGYPVKDWQSPFGQGKTADFTVIIPLETDSVELLVEVKAPSWTRERREEKLRRIESLEAQRRSAGDTDSAPEIDAELAREKASLPRINSELKYRDDDVSGGAYDFRADLERALVKAGFEDDGSTPRLPDNRPTLLVIVDDLHLGMQSTGGEFTVKRGLYYQPSRPVYPRGLFLDSRFNRVGGIATLEKAWLCELRDPKRRFTFFPNYWALPACRLPNAAFSDFLADLSQFRIDCNR